MDIKILLTLISICISIIAVVFSVLSYRYNKNKGKVEKAIDLANIYRDLIKDIQIIMQVLSAHTDIYEIVTNRLSENKISEFTSKEAEALYTEEDWDKLNNFFCGQGMNGDLLKGLYVSNTSNLSDLLSPMVMLSDFEQTNLSNTLIREYYKRKITDFLNQLEAFSMAFVQNVADDDVVYQSLHQSYIKIVKLLYFRISISNDKVTDKYYTNVIQLYNNWRSKEVEFERKISRANKKMESKINKVSSTKPKIKL